VQSLKEYLRDRRCRIREAFLFRKNKRERGHRAPVLHRRAVVVFLVIFDFVRGSLNSRTFARSGNKRNVYCRDSTGQPVASESVRMCLLFLLRHRYAIAC